MSTTKGKGSERLFLPLCRRMGGRWGRTYKKTRKTYRGIGFQTPLNYFDYY